MSPGGSYLPDHLDGPQARPARSAPRSSEPLRLPVGKDPVLGRRLVDEDVVGERVGPGPPGENCRDAALVFTSTSGGCLAHAPISAGTAHRPPSRLNRRDFPQRTTTE